MHHLFVFFFNKTIPVCPFPETTDEVDNDLDYFCVQPGELEKRPLPFAWEKIAEVTCDRRIERPRRARVIVGRRTDRPASAGIEPASGAGSDSSPIRQTAGYR